MEENNLNSNKETNIINEKGNKSILIILMALIIVLLAGYIIYTKFIEKEPNKPINNTEEQETSMESDVLEKAYDLILHSNIDYFGTKYTSVSEIPMKDKLENVFSWVEIVDSKVSEQKVKEKYESIYYDNYSPVNSGTTGCERWTRDSNGNYEVEGMGCGSGSISNDKMAYISSANKKGDTIEVVAYFAIFYLYDSHDMRDYTNNKVILQDASIFNEDLDIPEEFEKFDISKYENEFQHYKYTFKLKNGSYTLYSIEPVK